MERYLTTKGLTVTPVGESRYALEDAFGACSIPFSAPDIDEVDNAVSSLAGVRLLCRQSELAQDSDLSTFKWFELEKYYVAKLTDHFRYWQVGTDRVDTFDALCMLLPNAYLDLGFGSGSRAELEEIDRMTNEAAESGNAPFTKQLIAIRLAHLQLGRICSDIMSLIHRSIRAFLNVLALQRLIIRDEAWSLQRLNAREIIHSGRKSYRFATDVTFCVISLCTSLDLSSKLIHFLNGCPRPVVRFKAPQGKHFSDLPKMKAATLPTKLVADLVSRSEANEFLSLIQMRHDLVHSTAALEMEKVYVGYGTGVKELPLHYSSIPWRDCTETGQPDRYLGRDYFASSGVDIEFQLLAWLRAAISFHLHVGDALYQFMSANIMSDTGARLCITGNLSFK
jgi:hypothetical protein